MAPARGEAAKPGRGAPESDGHDKVYKMIEVVGTSRESFAEAVKSAVRAASKTVSGIKWFEVSELRGAASDGEVTEFQVTVKLGFRVEDR